ncbi:MAG: ATP-dependent DNA helicase RecG [Acidobacteria bacterium]|nr:ATP-dependent DNA helicase RecG [Acidobacteriota bacterium]
MISTGDRLTVVRGIGPRWAAELAERGVATVGDLLAHLPFRYEDRRRPAPLSEARPGQLITAVGTIRSALPLFARRGMQILTVLIDDGTAAIPLRFFNRNYLAQWMTPGTRLVVYGVPKLQKGLLELPSPDFDLVRPGEDPAAALGWLPVYEKLGPLTPKRVRVAVRTALAGLGEVEDPFPPEVVARLGLPARRESILAVHLPPAESDAEELLEHRTPGHRRMAFEEFFLLELGLAVRRARRRAEQRPHRYAIDEALRRKLADLLPFTLTAAQHRVLREIGEDLRAPWPMNRLLMGDVGSGKTVVAALAMMVAVENGRQAAIMAPTEILAQQHATTLQKLLLKAGLRVELLTAGLPAAQQRETRARIASGQARLAVGTHSLISESVTFPRLGIIVIDEQQRFGVLQRADMVAKADRPDVLVMTATPIPRTLAMVLYGDLDVSILDEKPPGRPPIKTHVRTAEQREQVFEGLERALAGGRQVYVVHPAVEEGPAGLRAAERGLREYRARFPQARIAMVHGRMKSAERQANLDAFAEGAVQLLVATTVIEVGIDVAAASVIVVEDADRFGLAQLHQLRGRVGRGDRRSYCVLIASADAAPDALYRLKVLEETSDGFRVAEQDLRLRGAGELAGTAQSGVPSFHVADIVRHQDLLLAAREEAFRMVQDLGEAGLPVTLFAEALRRYGERLRLATVG